MSPKFLQTSSERMRDFFSKYDERKDDRNQALLQQEEVEEGEQQERPPDTQVGRVRQRTP